YRCQFRLTTALHLRKSPKSGGRLFAFRVLMALKRFVYILKNDANPTIHYTGVTSNVAQRLAAHNDGQCPHTARNRPWSLDVVVEFADEPRALAFERYLKSGSGCAFSQRHLRSPTSRAGGRQTGVARP